MAAVLSLSAAWMSAVPASAMDGVMDLFGIGSWSGTGSVKNYTPRMTAPYNNDYYTSKNYYYNTGYGMPNCTAYAYGRAYEILGTQPNLCYGNANLWYDYNRNSGAYPYGSTPKLGAIACWGGNHVAVVEAIQGDTITISESHYSGTYFDTRNLTVGQESNYVRNFQGYIYILNDNTRYVAPKPVVYTTGYRTTASNGLSLNLRATPDTNSEIIDKIPDGTRVYVNTVTGDWGRINYNGKSGWISLVWTK